MALVARLACKQWNDEIPNPKANSRFEAAYLVHRPAEQWDETLQVGNHGWSRIHDGSWILSTITA
jgi:hypothetical protein